jgi:hypothetical protein
LLKENTYMETSAPHDRRSTSCLPITGPQRLALWKAAQKQLRGKLDPQEVTKMRKEWEQTPQVRR